MKPLVLVRQAPAWIYNSVALCFGGIISGFSGPAVQQIEGSVSKMGHSDMKDIWRECVLNFATHLCKSILKVIKCHLMCLSYKQAPHEKMNNNSRWDSAPCPKGQWVSAHSGCTSSGPQAVGSGINCGAAWQMSCYEIWVAYDLCSPKGHAYHGVASYHLISASCLCMLFMACQQKCR